MVNADDLAQLDALYEIDPWGEERADLRMGIIASTVSASKGGKSKPSDFMPYYEKKTADDVNQTHLKAKWLGIAKRWNRNHG